MATNIKHHYIEVGTEKTSTAKRLWGICWLSEELQIAGASDKEGNTIIKKCFKEKQFDFFIIHVFKCAYFYYKLISVAYKL